MSNDVIFYVQLASVVIFVIALFGVYRLVVQQKDSVIQLLKERLREKDGKIEGLESRTPDALATALSSRIRVAIDEIDRLKADGDKHKEEIRMKEEQLQLVRERLDNLSALIAETDLICKKCGAPLSERSFYPISGYVGGREVEAQGEYVEYQCGLALREGIEVSPCRG